MPPLWTGPTREEEGGPAFGIRTKGGREPAPECIMPRFEPGFRVATPGRRWVPPPTRTRQGGGEARRIRCFFRRFDTLLDVQRF